MYNYKDGRYTSKDGQLFVTIDETKCFYKRTASKLFRLIDFIVFVVLVLSYIVIAKNYFPVPEEKTLGFVLWANAFRISLLLFSIGFLFEIFKLVYVFMFLQVPEELTKYFKSR